MCICACVYLCVCVSSSRGLSQAACWSVCSDTGTPRGSCTVAGTWWPLGTSTSFRQAVSQASLWNSSPCRTIPDPALADKGCPTLALFASVCVCKHVCVCDGGRVCVCMRVSMCVCVCFGGSVWVFRRWFPRSPPWPTRRPSPDVLLRLTENSRHHRSIHHATATRAGSQTLKKNPYTLMLHLEMLKLMLFIHSTNLLMCNCFLC